jgi:hypothetical protein
VVVLVTPPFMDDTAYILHMGFTSFSCGFLLVISVAM